MSLATAAFHWTAVCDWQRMITDDCMKTVKRVELYIPDQNEKL